MNGGERLLVFGDVVAFGPLALVFWLAGEGGREFVENEGERGTSKTSFLLCRLLIESIVSHTHLVLLHAFGFAIGRTCAVFNN